MTFTPGTPNIDLVGLVEIEVGHRIDTDVWTQDGTYTNCWWINHLAEGEPSRVREKDITTNIKVTYTERASLTLCNNNAKSWYYDITTGYLYINTTRSDNPAVGDYLISSYFWERFASEPIVLDGHDYRPSLDLKSLSAVSQSTSGYHEGGTTQSFGDVRLINADGYFDERLSTYIWEAKKIYCRIGRRTEAYANYQIFWIGWTSDITWSDTEVEIQVEDYRTIIPY